MQVKSLVSYLVSSWLVVTSLLVHPAWAQPSLVTAPVSDVQGTEAGTASIAVAPEPSHLLASLDGSPDPQKIEGLLQATRHSDPYIRYVGTWGLGRTSIPPALVEPVVACLRTGLADSDPWVVKQSLESLGEVWRRIQQTHSSLMAVVRSAFIQAAAAPNPWVRAEAAWGLEYWRGVHSVERDLEILLHDPVPLVRSEAYRFFPIAALPLDRLRKGLRDESATIRYMSLNRLRSYGYYKHPDVQQLVLERLRDPDGQIVYESVFFLADYQIEAAIRPILDLLNTDWDWERVVKRAIAAYTSEPLHEVQNRYHWKPDPHFALDAPLNVPAPAKMAQIIQSVDAEDELEQATALLQLAWVDSQQAEDALNRALRGNRALARYTVLEVLRTRLTSYSPVASMEVDLEELLQRLQDAHPQVRASAMTLVGTFYMRPVTQHPSWDQGRITELLRKHVKIEKDGFVKAAALSALLRLKGSIAPRVAVKLLQDPFFQVREAAVNATDLLQYPKLLQAVLSHFADPNPGVRSAAVTQFRRPGYSQQFQGNEELVIALRRVATTDPDEMVRTLAQQSLEFYD